VRRTSLLKLVGVGGVGAVLVVWLFTTFVMRHNRVVIEHDDDAFRYTVDDGAVFSDPTDCAQHCRRRREWNLQNTVEIRCKGAVGASAVERLEEAMIRNQVYPWARVNRTGLPRAN